MDGDFLEERVVRTATDAFVWGRDSESERLRKLLLANPDADETERTELQIYNSLFQRHHERKRRSYIFDLAFRNGSVIPLVSTERTRVGVPYTMRAPRRVLILREGVQVDSNDLARQIETREIRYHILPAGSVVYIGALMFMPQRFDQALVPVNMYATEYRPRTFLLDDLTGKTPEWILHLKTGPEQILAVYNHYLNGTLRDGLYDPTLGYYPGTWTPENLSSSILRRRAEEANTLEEETRNTNLVRKRYPLPATPNPVAESLAYQDHARAVASGRYLKLQDAAENGIVYWASGIVTGRPQLLDQIQDPGLRSQTEELAEEARIVVDAYRRYACRHFHIRSRYDAAFKAETRHISFSLLERMGTDRPDHKNQYHCTECDLPLYCRHEELLDRKYQNPLLDIETPLAAFEELSDSEVVLCHFCRRFIRIRESSTNIEFDENDRRIVGRGVESDNDIRFKQLATVVARTLQVRPGKQSSGVVKPELVGAYWFDTLRPVIQSVYAQAREKSTKYSFGVINLLIILGYVIYGILVEGSIPASTVMGKIGDNVPDLDTLVRNTLDASSRSLFIHNILSQIGQVPKREALLKNMVQMHVFKILGTGGQEVQQQRNTVMTHRYVFLGRGGPSYTSWILDNTNPGDREWKIGEPPVIFTRRIPRFWEFTSHGVRSRRDPTRRITGLTRVYNSVCYGADGHWHDWDINIKSPNPMNSKCVLCGEVYQKAYDLLMKGEKEGVPDLFRKAEDHRLRGSEQIRCPRGGFHQIDLDVCLRCGQTLDEINQGSGTKEDKRPETKRGVLTINVPKVTAPTPAPNLDLDSLMAAYIKILSRALPMAIDPIKEHLGKLRRVTQYTGGILDEYRVRRLGRAIIRGPNMVGGLIQDCIDNLGNNAEGERAALAREQAAFWKAAAELVRGREYDERILRDREIDREQEHWEKMTEFFSKTMDQKIAEALLEDQEHLSPAEAPYDEEPEDLDSEGELNNEEVDQLL